MHWICLFFFFLFFPAQQLLLRFSWKQSEVDYKNRAAHTQKAVFNTQKQYFCDVHLPSQAWNMEIALMFLWGNNERH